MKERYCYWSVVNGPYALMMQNVVDSARLAGVYKDFHIWTDQPIEGALCHEIKELNRELYLFKLHFLQNEVRKLNYDYFVWLDADTWFVRNPGDVLRVMQGSPVHSSLESDATSPKCKRQEWWGCSMANYVKLMRFKGVRSQSIFNVNAGFWIVHHDVIETFYGLAMDFWEFSTAAEMKFTEEPPLAYATHMLCGNPYIHTLRNTADLWASDWTGAYQQQLPDGQPWTFTDYFTGEQFDVNPAIVHAMRCKEAMVARAEQRPASRARRSFRRRASDIPKG